MTRVELLKFQAELCDLANSLMSRKNQDYATGEDESGDVFANFRLSERTTGVPAEVGILVRLSDKISRLGQLLKKDYDAKVRDESIEDTVLDIINYAVLIAAYRHNKPVLTHGGNGCDYDPVESLLPRDRWCRSCD